ncbi:MAG: SH3 domain-containing protein [Erythrobacter sp.]
MSFVPEARAQERETPYWATLRFNEVNMRVGPSTEYPIEWVYQREGLPVKVVRLLDGWRFVEDSEGTQGWIASSQLSPSLGVLIVGDGNATLRADAAPNSAVRWRAEPGVVGDLMWCRDDYCEIDVGGRTGWILKERIWGAGDMAPAP